jgi:hypothetical protein
MATSESEYVEEVSMPSYTCSYSVTFLEYRLMTLHSQIEFEGAIHECGIPYPEIDSGKCPGSIIPLRRPA